MKKYDKELEKSYDPLLVMEEARRCLLCHDAPCSKECPAKTDPAKFIRSVRFKNFKGAAETIRKNNFLGDVCARVCPTEKYCQKGCSRSGIDRPIEIGLIQKFVTDFEKQTNMKILEKGRNNNMKVCIVGSGPSGLQAAASLSMMGYEVTIIEKNEKAGGYLRYGIPSYRLEEKVLDNDINTLKKDLKVKFIFNTKLGVDVSYNELKKQYDAVILAIGYSKGKMLPMFENNKHVEVATDFLKRVKENKGNIEKIDSCIVIGGGDVAMDVCSTLKMLETKQVIDVIYEDTDELRASNKELQLARELNVNLLCGYKPVKVENNTVTFEHRKLSSQLVVTADKIILAVGQELDLEDLNLEVVNNNLKNKKHQIKNNLFATGDVVSEDKTVVYSVKHGKEVAIAVDNYLKGGK